MLATSNAFGERELLHRPNLLRAMLMEDVSAEAVSDRAFLLECNLDDISAEVLGAADGETVGIGGSRCLDGAGLHEETASGREALRPGAAGRIGNV